MCWLSWLHKWKSIWRWTWQCFLTKLALKERDAVIVMMMMNCFCGMVDWRKEFSLISSWDHCQRSSPLQISDTPRAEFEPVQNLSSGLVEWSCAVVITTTPQNMPNITLGLLKRISEYETNNMIKFVVKRNKDIPNPIPIKPVLL